MKRFKKLGIYLMPLMVISIMSAGILSCTPGQTTTAKSVFSKVSFYSSLARALIKVARDQYKTDTRVVTALEATEKSLLTLESLVALFDAGVMKDESRIVTALVVLTMDVFKLKKAIEDAIASKKASP